MRKLADLGGRESAQAAYEARLAERASQLDREQAQLAAAQLALKQEQERLHSATKVDFAFCYLCLAGMPEHRRQYLSISYKNDIPSPQCWRNRAKKVK